MNAFGGRRREIGEDFVHVPGIRDVSRAIGIRISRVDNHTRRFGCEIGEFAGRNQNVRHGRPLLFSWWKLGSIRNPFQNSAQLRRLAASCEAAWLPELRWRR